MSVFTQAFYDRMSGDATLTALLGTYGGAPSVLTKRPLPQNFTVGANGPYVLTTGSASGGGGPADVKNSSGREIVRDILAFTSLDASPALVDSIADRIFVLFHRVKVSVTGYTIIVAEALGPIEVDEDDVLGRVVSVRWTLEVN